MNSTNLKNFLNQPYPYYYEGKVFVKFLIFLFLLVFCFNYLLQPFETNYQEHKISYFWISVIHSLSPILILIVFATILNKNLKYLTESQENWNIKKEFFSVFLVFFLTAITQFLVRDILYFNDYNWSWRYLIEEILHTFISGIFLSFIIIPFNYLRLQLKNQEKANNISATIIQQKEIFTENHKNETSFDNIFDNIFITTELKSEDFLFHIQDFLYAKSEGNYMEIYFSKNNEIIKLIKRLPLKSLENQLSTFKFIIKIHRSIILNLNAVEKVSGNAQGYKVSLKNYPTTIPVSRSFITIFENALQTLQIM